MLSMKPLLLFVCLFALVGISQAQSILDPVEEVSQVRAYKHPLHDFNIDLPAQYVIDQKYEGAIVVAYPKNKSNIKSPVVIIKGKKVRSNFGKLTKEDVNAFIAYHKEIQHRSTFSNPKKVDLNGWKGYRSKATEMISDVQMALDVYWFYYQPANTIYQLMVGATNDKGPLSYNYNEEIIEQIQNSFRLPVQEEADAGE